MTAVQGFSSFNPAAGACLGITPLVAVPGALRADCESLIAHNCEMVRLQIVDILILTYKSSFSSLLDGLGGVPLW
jgi:hypothetical protein